MAKPFYRRYSLEFSDEQREHGELAHWIGEGGYLRSWGRATLENWQSEFLQLFAFVVLSAILHHEGSPEARDSEEQTARTDRRARVTRPEGA
jgi:hypothetical protein